MTAIIAVLTRNNLLSIALDRLTLPRYDKVAAHSIHVLTEPKVYTDQLRLIER